MYHLMIYLPSWDKVTVLASAPSPLSPSCSRSSPWSDQSCTPSPPPTAYTLLDTWGKETLLEVWPSDQLLIVWIQSLLYF